MLKLILADNQAIFRAGIAKVLAVEDEMRIVAQAQTQEQFLSLAICGSRFGRFSGKRGKRSRADSLEPRQRDLVGRQE